MFLDEKDIEVRSGKGGQTARPTAETAENETRTGGNEDVEIYKNRISKIYELKRKVLDSGPGVW